MPIPAEIKNILISALDDRAAMFSDTREAFGDYTPEDIANHEREQEAAKAWLAAQTTDDPLLTLVTDLWDESGLDNDGDLIAPGHLSESNNVVADIAKLIGREYQAPTEDEAWDEMEDES